jgi:hypothetical protein
MVALPISYWRELSPLRWRRPWWGPAQAVVALVEKMGGDLEKTTVGGRRSGEEGGQLGDAMEKDQGGLPRSRTVEMLAVGPTVVVENAERCSGGARLLELR